MIGIAVPLHGEGQAVADDIVRAAELAVADANQSAEVQDAGYHFMLSIRDDRADPETAYEVARRFAADERLVGVIGHREGGTSLLASTLYDEEGVPFLSLSPSPLLTERSVSHVFRMVPREDECGEAMADAVLESLEPTRVAVVSDEVVFQGAAAKAFAARMLDAGVEVTSYIEIGEVTDLGGVADILARQAPDFVFLALQPDDTLELRRAMLEREIPSRVGIRAEACNQAYVDGVGEAGEGDLGVSGLSDLRATARGRDFLSYFETTFEREPHECAAYAYDAVWAFVRCVLAAGPDREAVNRELGRQEFSGVTGEFAFDENGEPSGRAVAVYVVRDGAWAALE